MKTYQDVCEWNPIGNRPAWENDPFHANAEMIVGVNNNWRLCLKCANLPAFKRYRARKFIQSKR